jgi:iron complex outermembrane recepter protein
MLLRLTHATFLVLAVMAMSLNAQTAQPSPDAAGTATAGAVVVTGSNIPTADEVTPSNVDTLTDREVKRSGVTGDILQVLTKIDPDFTGAGNLGSTNANISANYGVSTIAIRGLPTLVLMDGRRIVDSSAIAAGGGQFTDVSIFPTALINRIEVLKDGASALYGSEAVGGVVNVFLNDNYTGFEMGYRYGFTVESGVAERRAYAIAGVGNETTHVTAAFQYYETDPLYESERAYSSPVLGQTINFAGAGFDALEYGLLQAHLNSPLDQPGVHNGSVLAPPAGSPGTAFFSGFDANGTPTGYAFPQFTSPALNGAYIQDPTGDLVANSFDLGKVPTSTQKQRNVDEYASFTHDIFGKQLEVFGNFLFAQNTSFSQLNAQPLSTDEGVIILGTKRIDPVTGNVVAENRGAPAPFNPFELSFDQAELGLLGGFGNYIANRFVDHPRTFEQENDFYRLLGGMRSQINKDWFAEGAVYYSHDTISFVNGGLVLLDKLNALIAGNDPDFPGQSLDFFARNIVGTGPGQLTPAAYESIFGSNFRKLDSYQKSFDARVTGFPFELPGGGVGVSVGAEYRDEGFKVQDSPEIFVGSVPIGVIDVGRGISSYYGEIRVPIVGSEMQVPGVYSLEFSAAGRHDHYEGVSKDANVPKLTARYQPIKDLTLRATYSNSFVAPTLYETNGPLSAGFSPQLTIDGVEQNVQAQVLNGSNPNLIPSTAESYTAGIVYSPSYLSGLTISADYFRTLQQNIVGTIGGATILTSVNDLGAASPFASLVAFGNFPGQVGATPVTAPGQIIGRLASVFYVDINQNLGAARVEGFDLSARYLWDLKAWGHLELGVQSVVYTLQDQKTLPSYHYYNISGGIGDEGIGAFPDYRITFLAEYRVMGFTLSASANYIPEMHNIIGIDLNSTTVEDQPIVKSYFAADARLQYDFHRTPEPVTTPAGKDSKGVAGQSAPGGLSWGDRLLDGLSLAIGCNNLFQEGPPFMAGANSNTNLATYDPFGRFVYFEVSHKF